MCIIHYSTVKRVFSSTAGCMMETTTAAAAGIVEGGRSGHSEPHPPYLCLEG